MQQLGAIPGLKIITYAGDTVTGNFDMNGERIVSTPVSRLLLLLDTHIFRPGVGGAFTVRRLTNERDATTGLPIKKVRMYEVKADLSWRRVPRHRVIWASTHEEVTGRHLGPEKGVVYE